MTLEQLRIFVAVAEREHVTRAARELNLTQSATSAAVSVLEARHSTRLFDRIGRRIVLTDAGRIFLGEARAVLARAEAAETVLTDLAGLKRGSLKLAASQTVANYWLPRAMAAFQARHPGVALVLSIGNSETVAASIQDGTSDLGFVEGDVDDPALFVEAVAEDRLVLVVPRSHPWTESAPLPERDFRNVRWVVRERGSGTRSILEGALPGLGVSIGDLDVVQELPSNEAVRLAVEAGAGVAVMSRLVAERALAAGSLVAIDIALPKRQFLALRHKERYVTRAAKVFRELLLDLHEIRSEAETGHVHPQLPL